MNKTIFFILVILSNFSYAQEFETIDTAKFTCSYLYTFQQNSTGKYSVKTHDMILQIGSRYSKFISANKLYNDSIIRMYSNQPPTQAIFDKMWPLIQGSPTHSYCRYRLYKNYPEKGVLTLTEYINKQHIKTIETTPLNWKIEANSDTSIVGYKCTKATTQYAGRDYIAWFTMDIPINDGPYKFQGLPGLIIKIYDTQNQHNFELTGFTKSTYVNPIIFIRNKFVEITPEEHVKALYYHFAQLFNKIQHEDGVILNSDETKARALNNLKTRNNYIEKY